MSGKHSKAFILTDFLKSRYTLFALAGIVLTALLVFAVCLLIPESEPISAEPTAPESSRITPTAVVPEKVPDAVALDVATGSDYADIGICCADEEKENYGQRLSGVHFSVTFKSGSAEQSANDGGTVYKSGGNSSIVISGLEAGDYTVILNELEGYTVENKTVEITIAKAQYIENILQNTQTVSKDTVDEEDPDKIPQKAEQKQEESTPPQPDTSSGGASSGGTASGTVSQPGDGQSYFAPPVTDADGSYIYQFLSRSAAGEEYRTYIKPESLTEIKIRRDTFPESSSDNAESGSSASQETESGENASAEESASSDSVTTQEQTSSETESTADGELVCLSGYIAKTETHLHGLLAETATEFVTVDGDELTVYRVSAVTERQAFTPGFFEKDGNTYYLKEDGCLAVGWYNIALRRRYFDEKGVLSSVCGIDVSSYQKEINWSKVAADGIDFAIIRAGFRGYETGVNKIDSYCIQNIQGAKAAGLDVGLYFFSQATTVGEAAEEASILIDLAKQYGITMPLVIDTELIGDSGARADTLSAAQRTAVVKAFCETVKSAGYTPMIYTGKNFYENNLIAGELSQYKLWIARYPADAKLYETPGINGNYDIWQYASDGKVNGITGNVDMNSMIIKKQ